MKPQKVSTTEALVKALAEKSDVIIIEGELAGSAFRVIATGNVAWAIAISAIVTAFVALVPSGGTVALVIAAVGAGIVGIMGFAATTLVISVLFCCTVLYGDPVYGKKLLELMRRYKITEHTAKRLMLELR